jgi:hypothetical protein
MFKFIRELWSRLVARKCVLAMLCLFLLQRSQAQLAITEAMSSASTNSLADFWELTNFGATNIDLNGYRWNDDAGGRLGDPILLSGITISNGETIVFVQTNTAAVPTVEAFRAWWGAGMPANTRLFPYLGNGFSAGGDGVRLWAPAATNDSDVIDRVDFERARRGTTFTYDPLTGLFGSFSVTNTSGTFKAESYDDIGSPGVTTGPVPLQIVSQPASVTVCAGIDVTFSVFAGGLPRPQYQWLFNGVPLSGANSPQLTISNPQATNAGTYAARISNGTNLLVSSNAVLTVSVEPTAPVVFTPFVDVQVVSNETARFFAAVCAFPLPTIQWTSNGIVIPDATNWVLLVRNTRPAMSGSQFCANITNGHGGIRLCATLTVFPRPQLVITEVMAAASTNCGMSTDWFEVTNLGTNIVDLMAYRFATGNGQPPSLEGARYVTNSALLRPGKSAVFIRAQEPERFRDWWGTRNLPHDLLIIPFSGIGLDAAQDELYLWAPGAENANDYLTVAFWSGAITGVSKYFLDDIDGAEFESVANERGAFISASCVDVGSPGFTNNLPARFVEVTRSNNVTTLVWRAIPNTMYVLKWKAQLEDAPWQFLTNRQAAGWIETFMDTAAGSTPRRFYSVEPQL